MGAGAGITGAAGLGGMPDIGGLAGIPDIGAVPGMGAIGGLAGIPVIGGIPDIWGLAGTGDIGGSAGIGDLAFAVAAIGAIGGTAFTGTGTAVAGTAGVAAGDTCGAVPNLGGAFISHEAWKGSIGGFILPYLSLKKLTRGAGEGSNSWIG